MKRWFNIILLVICLIPSVDPIKNEGCRVSCVLEPYKKYHTGFYVNDKCWCVKKKLYKDAVKKEEKDIKKWNSEVIIPVTIDDDY